MKKVKLTQGKTCIVCDCHYDMILRKTWHYAQGYARTNAQDSDGKLKIVSMNRYILNPPKGLDVDHINRNTLDNRCSNLRAISRSLNKHNGHLYKTNKTGFRGVTMQNGKYKATISLNGEQIYLGLHNTIEGAVTARAKAEKDMLEY